MKHSSTRLALVAISAVAMNGISSGFAQADHGRKPVVIQAPAVANGSNWSRAPFPAARQFDDVRPADGQAIDKNLPPNTASTDPNPDPLPLPRVAIFQPAGRSAVGDPGLLPTGRPTVAMSTGLDGAGVANSLRGAAHSSRDAVLADLESRWAVSHASIRAMRGSAEMGTSGRAQFSALDEETKDLDKEMRKALREARYASAEDWESAKTRLASAYEAYAAGVARIDASAGLAPVR